MTRPSDSEMVHGAPYARPEAGLPPQTRLHTGRAVFTTSYAVIPRGVMTDIVASRLPHWHGTRAWVLARPLSGFAETFSHYVMEVEAGGGSQRPEPDAGAEGWLFVTHGRARLTIDGAAHDLAHGAFVHLPAACDWTLANVADAPATFHWLRKAYEAVDGLAPPSAIVTSDRDVAPTPMPDTDGAWATTRFVDPDDLAHDAHVNIVTLQPGTSIPFEETHVMEHGLYVLEGHAVYRLNRDWVEVEAGDYMWLRAFCPQACYAGGPGPLPLPPLQGRQPARRPGRSPMTRTIRPGPLTPDAFAPFGEVLDPAQAERRTINAGRCTRFHALAGVPVTGNGARVVVNLFRTQPVALSHPIAMMERHPLGAQAFWPLSGRPWLVVVAPDEGGRPGTPRAFAVPPTIGVSYAPGTWHHPLLALGRDADFLVIDRDGPGENLEERSYDAPWTLEAALEATRSE